MICISLPLIAGIADRAAGTSAALTGPELMTENGCLTEQVSDVFWDRATLYALRGIFYTGNPDKALEILHRLSQRRLLGDHVPYAVEAWPEGSQRHLSAESGLYCRVITEGLFGIRPTGLRSFMMNVILPSGWNGMSLQHIRAFGSDFDLKVFCDSGNGLSVTVTEPEAVVPVKPVAREGWDIYTGPNYRYGPSIIINDDNSIDIWLATPGDYYGTNVLVPVSDAITPLQLGTAGVFAQKFTSNEDFGIISLNCPSWNSSAEGFTLKVYKWVNDYETTVSGAAVASKTFVNYADNSWLSIYKSDKEDYTETFPAGTYLWVMNGGTEKSGIWKCPDNGSGNYFWDKITWRHSVDGGKTWTDEADALLPSDGKRDAFSVCDPGVAKWGGWYYIAYTSTEEPNGFDNDLYIARSKTPTGPWEKWSGNGWGQDPQPVIDYEPAAGHESEVFGAGEPCIVVKDDVVYLYYSYNDYLVESKGYCTTTRVSVASAKDENWPGHLEYKGIALDKSDVFKPDHTDVKYICRSQKFVAIHAERRDTDSSRMRVWESNDGIHFTKGGLIEGELRRGIINAGMSGDAQGQVRYGVQQFLCYAHSDAPRVWGRWLTWFQPLDWVDVGK